MDMTTQRSKITNQSNSCQINRGDRNDSICSDQRRHDVTGIPTTNGIYDNVFSEPGSPLHGKEGSTFSYEKLKIVKGNPEYNTSNCVGNYHSSKRLAFDFSNHNVINRNLARSRCTLSNSLSDDHFVDVPLKPGEGLREFILRKPTLQQRRLSYASRQYRTMDSYFPVSSRSDLRKNSTMMLFSGQNKVRKDSVVAIQIRKDSGTRKPSIENKPLSPCPSLRRASFAVPQFLRRNNSDKSSPRKVSTEQFNTDLKINETDNEEKDVTERHFSVNVEIQITETTTGQDSGYVVCLDTIKHALYSVLGNSGKKLNILPSKFDNSVNDDGNGLSVKRKRSTINPPSVERLSVHRTG